MSLNKILSDASRFLFKNLKGNGELIICDDGTEFVLHKIIFDQGITRLKVSSKTELIPGSVYTYKRNHLTVDSRSSYNTNDWYTGELIHSIQHPKKGITS
jgi:hypothetical protein